MKLSQRTPPEESEPWGGFFILEDCPTHKVKRIWVHPGQRLSYQKHFRRSEHWIILEGRARITLDGKEIFLGQGESVDIPHLHKGALTESYREALGEIPLASEEEEVPYGEDMIGEKLFSEKKPDLSIFSETELKILASIKEHFKGWTAKNISEFSDNERGYIETPNVRLISYRYAKDLQI